MDAPQSRKLFQPMVPLALLQRVRDNLHELGAVGNAAGVRVELGVRREVGTLEDFGREEVELVVKVSMNG